MGNYLADSVEVSKADPQKIRVMKNLGHVGRVGYVVSDDGSVDVQVSEKDGGASSQEKIRLDAGDQFVFEPEDKWEIGEILITTTSATALTCRYFVK